MNDRQSAESLQPRQLSWICLAETVCSVRRKRARWRLFTSRLHFLNRPSRSCMRERLMAADIFDLPSPLLTKEGNGLQRTYSSVKPIAIRTRSPSPLAIVDDHGNVPPWVNNEKALRWRRYRSLNSKRPVWRSLIVSSERTSLSSCSAKENPSHKSRLRHFPSSNRRGLGHSLVPARFSAILSAQSRRPRSGKPMDVDGTCGIS